MRLKDKVAIITGAGRGIGRAYALGFADEGAKLVVADIISENAQSVVKEIEAKGSEGLAIQTDVSSEAGTVEMVKKTLERFGKIDILINNAAIYYGIGGRSWDAWSIEDWERMFAVNVLGGWLCIKAVAPHMIAQKKGKIINITSGTFDLGTPVVLPYTCSKGAVIALTRSIARGLGRHNINVNCISPGYTMSEASLTMPGRSEKYDESEIRDRCFRRAEEPEDLVGTAIFLASDDSAFVTGQTIVVDGGRIMH